MVMSSQSDVLKSLLRSTARSAVARVKASPFTAAVKSKLAEVSFGRVVIADEQLTSAVARVARVSEATVRSGHGRLRIDVQFEGGRSLLMALRPDGIAFAPFGPKEIAFAVEPAGALAQPHSHDVVAAIASEIARHLWRPALLRAPRAEPAAQVTGEHERAIVDLRSVSEVRWALRQRLPALLIEAIRTRAIEVGEGQLVLNLAIEGVRR